MLRWRGKRPAGVMDQSRGVVVLKASYLFLNPGSEFWAGVWAKSVVLNSYRFQAFKLQHCLYNIMR
jgi:hypothetical protein